MGWKLAKLDVCNVKPNDEKDVCLVLHEEKRAVIHGEVKFHNGKPVKDAAVKLFKKKKSKDCCDLIPITFAFTDECGQFLFGVDACEEYVIKAFFYEPEHCEDHDKFEPCKDYEKCDKDNDCLEKDE